MTGLKKKATSIDVARLAGVSQSTVSRTFSTDRSKVAPETREKVLAAARELGYTPDVIARSLSTQRTNIVGIVMADITSPFYPYVLELFITELQEAGRQVLLFTAGPHQEVDDILSLVLQYRVDALIITSATLSSEMADECAREGTPVILFNRYVPGAAASAVSCDNAEGGRLVANLFLDADHVRPAYIAGVKNASTNIDREKGFTDRLRERGQRECLREQGAYTYESGYECARRLLQRADPPDAIFCANDIMALGAIDAARDLAVRVSKELSIIGFDDIPAAGWSAYSLTTIRQPVNQMVAATLEVLTEQVEHPEAKPVTKLAPGTLIPRTSARLPSYVESSSQENRAVIRTGNLG
ncbi:MAG: HTH-type transcriptional regulator DegA [Anaerolineales bacterium]|nr:HTH-type transcriptional regulator DegA [Anaerolineales bacterium]